MKVIATFARPPSQRRWEIRSSCAGGGVEKFLTTNCLGLCLRVSALDGKREASQTWKGGTSFVGALAGLLVAAKVAFKWRAVSGKRSIFQTKSANG